MAHGGLAGFGGGIFGAPVASFSSSSSVFGGGGFSFGSALYPPPKKAPIKYAPVTFPYSSKPE